MPSTHRSPAFLSKLSPTIAFLLLLLAVYCDPLLTSRNFAGGDLLGYHLPVEKAIHDAYARGRLPIWLSEISGGRPLLASPNAGALYPLRPALSVLHFPMAMRLYPIVHWALAGLGMLSLGRALGWSSSAGWIACVTYVFSGVSIGHVFFTNLQPGFMILPWIVRLTAEPIRQSGQQILFLSLLFGLLLLAGDPFSIGMGLFCSVLWIALEQPRERRRRGLVVLSVSVLLAEVSPAGRRLTVWCGRWGKC